MKNKILISIENIDNNTIEWLNNNDLGVELDFFSIPENIYINLNESLSLYKKIVSKINNTITMHGSFYDLNLIARDRMIIDVAMFRVNQSIEIANYLKIKHIVFHCNYVHSTKNNYKEFWIQKQTEFWTKFKNKIEDENITIYLENTREEDYTYINQIIKNMNSNFKACYDTGHSNCFTNSKLKPVEWLQGYNQNVGYIHLHSNDSTTDQHICFTDGNIDFSNFFETYNKMENKPLLVIEVKKYEDVQKSLHNLKSILERMS